VSDQEPKLELVKEAPTARARQRPSTSWRPTNKWVAATTAAFLAATTLWINEGNSKAVAVAWLTLGCQAFVGYVVPNQRQGRSANS
jgi:hypothetical protein